MSTVRTAGNRKRSSYRGPFGFVIGQQKIFTSASLGLFSVVSNVDYGIWARNEGVNYEGLSASASVRRPLGYLRSFSEAWVPQADNTKHKYFLTSFHASGTWPAVFSRAQRFRECSVKDTNLIWKKFESGFLGFIVILCKSSSCITCRIFIACYCFTSEINKLHSTGFGSWGNDRNENSNCKTLRPLIFTAKLATFSQNVHAKSCENSSFPGA